jgi:hypothetical protein
MNDETEAVITVAVDDETAQSYYAAPPELQQQIQLLLRLRLRSLVREPQTRNDTAPPEQAADSARHPENQDRLPAGTPRRRHQATLAHARGLLAGEQPAPDDESIKRWLAERRQERYGS